VETTTKKLEKKKKTVCVERGCIVVVVVVAAVGDRRGLLSSLDEADPVGTKRSITRRLLGLSTDSVCPTPASSKAMSRREREPLVSAAA